MVLEVLINPTKASGKPWEMFLIGAVYSLVGAMLGYWVFRSHASIIMVTFTTIASIPFIHAAIKSEAVSNVNLEGNPLRNHAAILSMFIFLFLGFVAVYFTLFALLPQAMVSSLYSSQIDSIAQVRNTVSGNFFSTLALIGVILLNNIKVLFFCLLFSLVYGAGAIFILSWNASVMGAAIGNAIRTGIASSAGSSFHIVYASIAGYFLHGIPEMFAYFIGGLAGGIVSITLVEKGVRSPEMRKAISDALNLTGFALLILIIAGIVEVTLSPKIL